MNTDLALRRWLGLQGLAVPEVFDVIAAFEAREFLRVHGDQLTTPQRQAGAAADRWADANAASLLPVLTLPGNKLPPEHYARQFAARHAGAPS